MDAPAVKKALRALADPERARSSRRFFKTGEGQYGAGDRFIGVTVPEQRKVAKAFRGLPLPEILSLLESAIHEDRLTALLLLVDSYRRAKKDPKVQEVIVRSYLQHLDSVNNWDLVDSSSPQILGDWLLTRNRSLLRKLAKSPSLWRRRVAILATQTFINHGESAETMKLAELLLKDEEDLIHKATGWMLREVGQKVGLQALRGFLEIHAAHMPRTMLRYAIEKLPAGERRKWLGRS